MQRDVSLPHTLQASWWLEQVAAVSCVRLRHLPVAWQNPQLMVDLENRLQSDAWPLLKEEQRSVHPGQLGCGEIVRHCCVAGQNAHWTPEEGEEPVHSRAE